MWKQNLEETKKHYVDWWNHKGIVVNMWEHFQNGVTPHADVDMPPAPESLDQKWFDPAWRAEYLDWYVAHSSLKADMLPVANTQLGPGSLAAILGGVFEGGEDTIWIHPNPQYTDDIKFDENHPNWLLHKKLLRECKKKAQGHYYVGMPDLMEGLDVLAAMKGTDKVLLDTVMQPEVLERQMQQINDIYFKVFDELYDIIREGDEMAFCYFSAWAPGKMAKLQSDISTMISVDDYRRFVQPFIREQCRRLDYTLYHLDGVGALHHLPALLEIEELNAIQWTPGVGEPQGGSPKWYDLYRRILAAGKSIMACWVTLDELRPLLDNIGINGVHLEMDFHNEDEVEQAVRIVEEYREKEASRPAEDGVIHVGGSVEADYQKPSDADMEVKAIIDKVEKEFTDSTYKNTEDKDMTTENHSSFFTIPASYFPQADRRVLIMDGAMGTMIQEYNLAEEDFRGERFAQHGCPLSGNNDLLCITHPEIIEGIHRKYLDAGADFITTNTFNAQRISMADYRLEGICREINIAACRIARSVADEYTKKDGSKPRYVLGSMGPTSKTCSVATDANQPGWGTFSYGVLLSAYEEQALALIEGGVDAILVETIFDTENARAAIEASCNAMRKADKCVPLMLSFTVASHEGRNMLGQSVEDFIASLKDVPVLSVGINCTSDIREMIPFLVRLGGRFPYYISAYPNAGLPDASGHYGCTPEKMLGEVWPLLDGHVLNIVGGCCGTTDGHIKKLAEVTEPAEGLWLSPHRRGEKTDVAASYKAVPDTREAASHGAKTVQHECDCCKPTQAEADAEAVSADAIFDAILQGKAPDAADATRRAVDAGVAPQDIINGQMIRAMGEVGQRFQDGKAFVPQLLMAGRAMKAALELLKPLLAGDSSATIGKVVIGTVKGDLHDIGKNLVASMLEGCGFEVINVGIDVASDTFVDEVKKHGADILCMSALLTTTMTYMKDVISALEDAGIRDKVKVMVGGAPVTQSFADEIGADGYSDNANTAVAVAKNLMGVAAD